MAVDRRNGKHGLVMVSDETFGDLVVNSRVLHQLWIMSERALPKTLCTSALRPPMFVKKTEPHTQPPPPPLPPLPASATAVAAPSSSSGYDPRSMRTSAPVVANVSFDPKKAERLHGSFYNKRNSQKMFQWFSTFSSNFYAGRANPNPFLVVMGPTGSGKSFCVDWMCTAFGVDTRAIDPLDYKQTKSKKRSPPKPTKKTKKPKKKPTTDKKKQATGKKKKEETKQEPDDEEEDDDGGPVIDAREEEEAAVLKKLSAAAGPLAEDGEGLRQLLMNNTTGRPVLVRVQDIQLCRPEFMKFLIALVPIISRTPNSNGIVLEMNSEEAYRPQHRLADPSGGGGGSSLGAFLQKFKYATVLRFYPLGPHESRDYLLAHRHKLQLPVLPNDDETLSKITLEARGDLRQLEILLEWASFPYAQPSPNPGKPTPSNFAPRLVPRSLSPPPARRSTSTNVSSTAHHAMGENRGVSSDLEVGTMLLSTLTDRGPTAFGYEDASAIVQQLRSFPVFQVAEFLRSWLTSACPQLDTGEAGGPKLVSCSTDALVGLLVRSLQMEASSAARKSRSFIDYKHIRQLPGRNLAAIFGQPKRIAAASCSIIERILDQQQQQQQQQVTTQNITPTDNGAAVEPEAKSGRRRAVGLITIDKEGRIDIDKMVPRRKRVTPPAAQKEIPIKRSKPNPTTNSSLADSKVPGNAKIAVSAGTVEELRTMCAVSKVLSDYDIHPYTIDAESHAVFGAHFAFGHKGADLPYPDRQTISKWLHPRRFDFAGSPSRSYVLSDAPATT